MNITTSSAQVTVRTGLGHGVGINIRNDLSGYAAALDCWGGDSFYLCKLKDTPASFLTILALPSSEFEQDARDAGYTILGRLRDFANAHPAPDKLKKETNL